MAGPLSSPAQGFTEARVYAPFTPLPNEILYDVIGLLKQDDLHNLSKTCHASRMLCTQRLFGTFTMTNSEKCHILVNEMLRGDLDTPVAPGHLALPQLIHCLMVYSFRTTSTIHRMELLIPKLSYLRKVTLDYKGNEECVEPVGVGAISAMIQAGVCDLSIICIPLSKHIPWDALASRHHRWPLKSLTLRPKPNPRMVQRVYRDTGELPEPNVYGLLHLCCNTLQSLNLAGVVVYTTNIWQRQHPSVDLPFPILKHITLEEVAFDNEDPQGLLRDTARLIHSMTVDVDQDIPVSFGNSVTLTELIIKGNPEINPSRIRNNSGPHDAYFLSSTTPGRRLGGIKHILSACTGLTALQYVQNDRYMTRFPRLKELMKDIIPLLDNHRPSLQSLSICVDMPKWAELVEVLQALSKLTSLEQLRISVNRFHDTAADAHPSIVWARRRRRRSGHGPGLPLGALTQLRRLILTGGIELHSENEEPHRYMWAQQEVENQAREIAETLPLLEYLQLDETCFRIKRGVPGSDFAAGIDISQPCITRLEDSIDMPWKSYTEAGRVAYRQHALYCRPVDNFIPRRDMDNVEEYEGLDLGGFDFDAFLDVPADDTTFTALAAETLPPLAPFYHVREAGPYHGDW